MRNSLCRGIPARLPRCIGGDLMGATRKTLAPQLVFIGGLEVWLTRKSIKNMHLRVKPPDGRIEVSAPLRLPMRTIERFVLEKQGWIEAQQRAIAASPRVEAAQASPEEVAQWKAVVAACVPPLIEAWEPILGVKAGKIGVFGICGGARAVPSAGTRPRPKVPCAHGRCDARLEGPSRQAAVGPCFQS